MTGAVTGSPKVHSLLVRHRQGWVSCTSSGRRPVAPEITDPSSLASVGRTMVEGVSPCSSQVWRQRVTGPPVLPLSPGQARAQAQDPPGPTGRGEHSAGKPSAAWCHISTSACHGLISILLPLALALPLQDSPEAMTCPEQDPLFFSFQLRAFPTSP